MFCFRIYGRLLNDFNALVYFSVSEILSWQGKVNDGVIIGGEWEIGQGTDKVMAISPPHLQYGYHVHF